MKKIDEKKPVKIRDPREYSHLLRTAKPTSNPLAQFSVCPIGLRFESQDPQEKVLLIMRRHFITNVPWILGFLVMLLAPLILPFFPIMEFLPLRYQNFTLLFWYLFSFGFLLERFLSWYFNVYIVTDERVVDIDFYSLIYKEISSTKIDRIEDISYTISGALRNLMNFGTVAIQTSAEKRQFEFEDVPHPEKVTGFLNELLLEEELESHEGRVR